MEQTNWDEYTHKEDLTKSLFSLFTIDEIETIIKARENRSKKLLALSPEEQLEARKIFQKIENMFDV